MIASNYKMQKVIHHTGKLLSNIGLDLANTIEKGGIDKCADSVNAFLNRIEELKFVYNRLMGVIEKCNEQVEPGSTITVKIVNKPIIEECISKYINNKNIKVNIVPEMDKIWIMFTYCGDIKNDRLYDYTYNYIKSLGLEGFCGSRLKVHKKLEMKYRDSYPMITLLVYEEMLKNWIIERLAFKLKMNEIVEFIFDTGGV